MQPRSPGLSFSRPPETLERGYIPCSVLSYFPAVMFLTVSLFLVNGPACR